MHFGVHNDIIAAFQITHGIYRWFGLNKRLIISNGDYLLELRLGPLKGLCCAKREKKRGKQGNAMNQVGEPKEKFNLTFFLSQFTSSSSSSLSSNAIPLADWLWLWELDLLNDDDDKGTDLVCGWEKDREQRHKKKKQKLFIGTLSFFFVQSWNLHTYLGGGRDVFVNGMSSSESSMVNCGWIHVINGTIQLQADVVCLRACAWLAHFIGCVGHCRAYPRWPLGWSVKRWSGRNTEEGGGKGMTQEK